MKPKVSIIVPIYNVEKYMRRGMNSILNQTLKEIEIILVDDGSTDSSGKIADEYMLIDSRVKVIHQKNKGLPGARNSGILVATGDYLGFVDPDDWVEKNMFEEMYKSAISCNSDITICNFIEENLKEDSKEIYKHNIDNGILRENEIKKEFINYIDNKKFFLWPAVWNKIYKRDFLEDNNLIQDETLKLAEDLCFNINAIMNAKIISGVDEVFYHYMRINPESLLNKFNEEKVYNHMYARKKIIEYLERYNIEVKDYTRYENCKNIRNYIDLCLFRINDKNSINNKYRNVKEILKSKELNEWCQNCDKKYLSKDMKIILNLIKNRMYFVIYGILLGYSKVKFKAD